jgi:heme exporter protein B
MRIYRGQAKGQDAFMSRTATFDRFRRVERVEPDRLEAGACVSRPGWGRTAWLVFAKDMTIEARTREIVTTAGFFAALVAILSSVAFYAGPETTTRVAPGAMWLAIAFASILALSRSWQREREEGALTGLLVAPVARSAIFAGKALGIFAFVTVVELIVVPVVCLLFHVELPDVAGALACVLLVGTVGVAATGTLFGAMTVRTGARDLVLASVLFPLLTPALVSGVAATREIFALTQSMTPPPALAQLAEVSDYLGLLAVFSVVGLAGGLTFFGLLIDE